MRKIGDLLLGIAFILLMGCNSNVSEKRNQRKNNNQKHSKLEQTVNTDTISSKKNQIKELLPKIDTRILDLLKKTETLEVPLTYSYEDQFDIGSIGNIMPLSDEILNLLAFDRIKNSKDDNYSGFVWKCSQIELSEKFITLVFTIYDGAIGQNVLINYTNNFEFIDHEFITYEDYIEGFSSMRSLIKKGEITTYYSDYEQLNDTTSFKIDEHGLIDVIKIEIKPSGSI